MTKKGKDCFDFEKFVYIDSTALKRVFIITSKIYSTRNRFNYTKARLEYTLFMTVSEVVCLPLPYLCLYTYYGDKNRNKKNAVWSVFMLGASTFLLEGESILPSCPFILIGGIKLDFERGG